MHNKKAKKRTLHLRKYTLYGIFAFIVLLILILSLCLTVLFDIREIEISGNNSYDKKLVLSVGNILVGDNIFTANTKSAEKNILETFSYFEDVSIKRILPHKMVIKITEAKITYIANNSNDNYDIISSNGKVMKKDISSIPNGYTNIKGLELLEENCGDYLTGNDKLKFDVIKKIKEELPKINSIDISNTANIIAEYDERITIRFGDDSSFEQKMEIIHTVLQKNDDGKITGIIDATNPKEIHFR